MLVKINPSTAFDYYFKRLDRPLSWVLTTPDLFHRGDEHYKLRGYDISWKEGDGSIRELQNVFIKLGINLEILEIEGSYSYDKELILVVTFDNEADEAEFILKVS